MRHLHHFFTYGNTYFNGLCSRQTQPCKVVLSAISNHCPPSGRPCMCAHPSISTLLLVSSCWMHTLGTKLHLLALPVWRPAHIAQFQHATMRSICCLSVHLFRIHEFRQASTRSGHTVLIMDFQQQRCSNCLSMGEMCSTSLYLWRNTLSVESLWLKWDLLGYSSKTRYFHNMKCWNTQIWWNINNSGVFAYIW